ncbi:styrene monooxygenase/indole monooxygenase family protein [Actinocatenispora rupis]|uniref:Alanine-phosphoribitol ligase n=1 Tax=Actinocatenispora rupis TaxID=519421 RepID=A0A8J3NES3_9ACTN|nr:styrene monooxygenase/indole monooxygenase family protein [Actinocatenispora rupis]GID12914.1 alanine-phosphoribitol ligase [Actinocatenispora rupis]
MRRILIVGAGQCGLQLGLGLLAAGYEVTIMSARTPEEIRAGWPTSTQAMFEQALNTERAQGLNLWDDPAPKINGMHIAVAMPPGTMAMSIIAHLNSPGQSTDQRVKFPAWLELFEERGGTVIYQGVTTGDLDGLTALLRYDLTIVAAGKGELTALFDRDVDRSPFTVPQRGLSVAYVHGLAPNPSYPERSGAFNGIPGLGEMFAIPGYTLSGECDILFFEAVPGSPADIWQKRLPPDEHLSLMVKQAREYAPWLGERCDNVELTDGKATLSGRYTPVVRRPVAQLPSGGLVLGAGDVVISNDPVTGQGANGAAKMAAAYLAAIVAHGDKPFDREWMERTFADFWETSGQWATMWTNGMLGEMPEHAARILMKATTHTPTADRFVNGFSDPSDFQHFFFTPEAADAYLASIEE